MFNDLINLLEGMGLQVYAYADDLAIIGTGREQLELVIQTIEKWISANKLKLNKNKSGVILHKKRRTKPKGEKNILGIPICQRYKYLGIVINEPVNGKDQLQSIKEKIVKPMKMLKILTWKRLDIWLRLYTWMTYIVPHFRYGALMYL